MSAALKMTARNTDYDAAQALLDLHRNMKQENPATYVRHTENMEDMENTAKLFWNCFISSEIPSVSNTNALESNPNAITFAIHPNIPKTVESYRNNLTTGSSYKDKVHYTQNVSKKTDRRIVKPRHKRLTHQEFKREFLPKKNIQNHSVRVNKLKTNEMGTQTEECYFNPNIELMEITIKNLCERIQSLEAQLKEPNLEQIPADNSGNTHSDAEENVDSMNESRNNKSYMTACTDNSRKLELGHTKEYNHERGSMQNSADHSRVISTQNFCSKLNDVVPIGDGHASVSARLLKHINWNSYTSATRKLLTAVFSRKILATHSLTGKPSPAFPNKPAKKKLDPFIVNDIVRTVVERCFVPENVVRTSITTKCADESKMFRTRLSNKRRRKSKKNRENLPPSTSDSESDNNFY